MYIQMSKNIKTFSSSCTRLQSQQSGMCCIELFMLHAFAAGTNWIMDGN